MNFLFGFVSKKVTEAISRSCRETKKPPESGFRGISLDFGFKGRTLRTKKGPTLDFLTRFSPHSFLSLFLLSLFLFFPHTTHANGLSLPATNLGLVGYWPLNEGAGTTAYDYSGRHDDGTLTNGPTWVNGKRGKALSFTSASTQYVSLSNLHNDITTGDYTFAAWVKLNSPYTAGGPTMYFVAVRDDASNNDSMLYFGPVTGSVVLDTYNGSAFNYTPSTQTSWEANQWYFIVGTYQEGVAQKIYVNGVLSNTITPTGTKQLPYSTHSSIGCNYANTTKYCFDGVIDEVRAYNRALSATEVATLYKSGGVTHKLPNNLGLVGYWSLNEGIGTTVMDYSGNGINGTFVNTPVWTSGKSGQALAFTSASSQSVQINGLAGKIQTGDVTFSAWVKFRTVYTSGSPHMTVIRMADAPSSNDIQLAFGSPTNGTTDGKFHVTAYTSSGFQDTSSVRSTWEANRWYHIAGTYQDGVAGKLYIDGVLDATGPGAGSRTTTYSILASIGKADSRWDGDPNPLSFFDGSIDEVRVYNRVLSSDEVAGLYNGSKYTAINTTPTNVVTSGLVGYWPFDGKYMNWGTGQVSDVSGNGNTGVFSNLSTTTSPVMGKVGQALNFNAVTNTGVAVSYNSGLSISGDITLSAWVYPRSYGGNLKGRFVDALDGVGNGYTWFIDNANITQGMSFNWNDNALTSNNNVITLNTWQHVLVRRSGNAITFFVNGVNAGSGTYSQSTLAPAGPLYIGYTTQTPVREFDGLMDEVRIYNRALSDAEIVKLYNTGK